MKKHILSLTLPGWRSSTFAALISLSCAPPLLAQDSDATGLPSEAKEDNGSGLGSAQSQIGTEGEIVVSAARPFGSVDTDLAAVDTLNAEDVASYGADSVEELLDALSPQIGSGRGRGGGRPVMLLNGRPVNDFREIRHLPPEAIKSVEIFPEELALKYGYRPDQRVVNLILIPNYAAAEIELEAGMPTRGGRTNQEYEFGFTSIGTKSRFNANIEYNHSGAIDYDERGLDGREGGATLGGFITSPTNGEIDPALSAAAGGTVTLAALPGTGQPVTLAALAAGAGSQGSGRDGNYRTLAARKQTMEAEANWSRQISDMGDLSLNGSYSISDSESNLGLQSLSLDVAAGNGFSPLASDFVVNRLIASDDGLVRDSQDETIAAGAGVNGMAGDWRWRLSTDISKSNSKTSTVRGIDADAVQAAVDAGTLNPFGGDIGALFARRSNDLSESSTLSASGLANVAGPLFTLPAGKAQLSVTAKSGYNRIKSEARVDDIVTSSRLSRTSYAASGSLDLPIADGGTGLGQAIGKFSINLNGGYTDLSDFGSLLSYGGGFNWSPADNLDLSASFIGEEAAPSLSNLGAPIIVTPNREIYDYRLGQSALIDYITGGNRDLAKEKRRDIKLTATWQPPFVEDLRVTGEYLRNRSYDVTASFPELTPAIEAAFPGRVTRDGSGQLIALDARPITYAETRNDALKLTLAYSTDIGGGDEAEKAGRPDRGGRDARKKPDGESKEGAKRGDRSKGGPPGFGPGRDRKGGRLRLSLGYQYQLTDEIDIADGLPTLDLMSGDATGSNGGTPRHVIEFESGLYMGGWGARITSNFESATHVDGDPLTGSSDLSFGELLTFDARLFFNLDELGFAEKVPLLENARMSLRVDNIFDSYRKVRNEDGDIPFRYRRAFTDPVGRYVEIDFRKRF